MRIAHRCPACGLLVQNHHALFPVHCPDCGGALEHGEVVDEPPPPPRNRRKCLGCVSFAVIHDGVVQENFQLRLRVADLRRELDQAKVDLAKLARTQSPLYRPQPGRNL
jgi:hypothetical protein